MITRVSQVVLAYPELPDSNVYVQPMVILDVESVEIVVSPDIKESYAETGLVTPSRCIINLN